MTRALFGDAQPRAKALEGAAIFREHGVRAFVLLNGEAGRIAFSDADALRVANILGLAQLPVAAPSPARIRLDAPLAPPPA